MIKRIDKSVIIQANPSEVWRNITDPEKMKQWMAEPEMEVEIRTNWEINSPVVITGFHHVRFENKGIVLQYEDNKLLKYSHLSSLSRLPDISGNYSVFTFVLNPVDHQTELAFSATGFPTESIFKHLDFYWKTTLELLKKFIERTTSSASVVSE